MARLSLSFDNRQSRGAFTNQVGETSTRRSRTYRCSVRHEDSALTPCRSFAHAISVSSLKDVDVTLHPLEMSHETNNWSLNGKYCKSLTLFKLIKIIARKCEKKISQMSWKYWKNIYFPLFLRRFFISFRNVTRFLDEIKLSLPALRKRVINGEN